jgi:hypothetical protein
MTRRGMVLEAENFNCKVYRNAAENLTVALSYSLCHILCAGQGSEDLTHGVLRVDTGSGIIFNFFAGHAPRCVSKLRCCATSFSPEVVSFFSGQRRLTIAQRTSKGAG